MLTVTRIVLLILASLASLVLITDRERLHRRNYLGTFAIVLFVILIATFFRG